MSFLVFTIRLLHFKTNINVFSNSRLGLQYFDATVSQIFGNFVFFYYFFFFKNFSEISAQIKRRSNPSPNSFGHPKGCVCVCLCVGDTERYFRESAVSVFFLVVL